MRMGELVPGSIADGDVEVSMRDELVDISSVEKGERGRGRQSWVSRFIQGIVDGYAMQLGIINIPQQLTF
jgi:hypothetical protein